MKQKLSTIIVACIAFALCLAFAGCGVMVDKKLYVGTWELQSSSDATFDSKTIELMKTLDVAVTLTLADDGTGALNYLGSDSHDAKWQASSNTEGKITIDDKDMTIALEEGKLTMTDADGAHMEFAKVSDEVIEAKPAATSSAASTSASAASAANADTETASGEAAATNTDAEKSGTAAQGTQTSENEDQADDTYDADGEGDYAYDDGAEGDYTYDTTAETGEEESE